MFTTNIIVWKPGAPIYYVSAHALHFKFVLACPLLHSVCGCKRVEMKETWKQVQEPKWRGERMSTSMDDSTLDEEPMTMVTADNTTFTFPSYAYIRPYLATPTLVLTISHAYIRT